MFEKLKEILVSEMDVKEEEIKPEAQLTSDLGLNSLELADLVLLCEDKFGVAVSDDDIRGFITVGDVVSYMEKSVQNG